MKQLLKLIVAILFMAITVNSYGAKNKDITLIVTSEGATKDEAIKNALRNAVEQTYGVFVSANTDILNDEVVSDEIVTIASGNIKSYKELSSSQSNGKTTVTLEAVVSIGKLISYAKSKGAECELDGASMFADIELQELYKDNEEKAIENLVNEIAPLFQEAFDYEIKLKQMDANYIRYGVGIPVGGIKIPGAESADKDDYVFFECNIKAKLNERGETAWKRLLDAMKAIGAKQSRFNSYLNGFQVTSTDIQIPAPMGIGNIYSFRSHRSVVLIESMIYSIPQIIRDVNISTNLGVIADLSKENLPYKYEAMTPNDMIKRRFYHKKKGKVCDEFVYWLRIPKSELKSTKTINITSNSPLPKK